MTHRRAQMGGREVRARVAVGLTVRAAGDDGSGPVISTGYASVTGAPYEMTDWWGDTYAETVDVGAFGAVLAQNPDVRLLINHEGIPLARTISGTLQLTEHTIGTTTGLWHQAEMDAASPLVQQVRSAMSRGDLTEMSFMFTCRAEWSPDYSQRNIREITGLYDVSLVTFPANPGTSAQLHGAPLVGAAEARAAQAVLGRLRERRALSPEDTATVQHLLNLFVAADVAVDEGQAAAAGLLGVANPDVEPSDPAESDEPAEDTEPRSAPLGLYRRRLALAT